MSLLTIPYPDELLLSHKKTPDEYEAARHMPRLTVWASSQDSSIRPFSSPPCVPQARGLAAPPSMPPLPKAAA